MGEYIEREDAIQAVKHAWAKGLEPSQYLEIIPAVDVAPVRHGRWKKEPTDSFGFEPDYICSVCRKYAPDDWHPKYCPNCGAKMDEKEENYDNHN